jgi:uncharacterized protein YrrD
MFLGPNRVAPRHPPRNQRLRVGRGRGVNVLKGKSVIGKEILSLEDGVKIDKVNDLVLDPAGQQVLALVVSTGGFMSSSKVVPIEEVSSFGKDAVVVRGGGSVVTAAESPDLAGLVNGQDRIRGKRVYTSTGEEQGSIADIYFEETTGQIVGYEVSGGMLGDATKGTSYLATDEITTIGSDVIYILPEAAASLDAQVGGVQGALQGAGEKLQGAGEKAGEKLSGAREAAGDGKKTSKAADSLVGKRTGTDVASDGGSVLIPKGRRVRPEDVEAAKAAGKLPALTAAVAAGTMQEAGAGAKDAMGSAGDTAASMWDQFTAKIGEMTDATGRRVDEAQTKKRISDIADAVGRPVSKVILDRQDNVILNMGDIITHQSIQRAYDSGGLDSLLASVYRGEVQFTKEEMRAPGQLEAEATVDKASGGATVVDELETKVESIEQERETAKQRKQQESEADRARREEERATRERERAESARQRASDEEGDDEDAASSSTTGGSVERERTAVGPGR